ncbi:hypothetical protein K458DRAFT_144617 [Lentithecium fluviatile CBS 122367]|uniref:Uncharacterized protein n=1 Tax=Lentithecium fluviatile CBS 122367 TaxID=1168545 RepID=A0A6G1IIB6_9PLEO|nr:hypothetical protein K458DRAFT_144617 [Lentithecium fluviatile CBS 122367]
MHSRTGRTAPQPSTAAGGGVTLKALQPDPTTVPFTPSIGPTPRTHSVAMTFTTSISPRSHNYTMPRRTHSAKPEMRIAHHSSGYVISRDQQGIFSQPTSHRTRRHPRIPFTTKQRKSLPCRTHEVVATSSGGSCRWGSSQSPSRKRN